MEVRKVLGGISVGAVKYGVGKLKNGQYAVGQLAQGQMVEVSEAFDTLEAAFDHWYAMLPKLSPIFNCIAPNR